MPSRPASASWDFRPAAESSESAKGRISIPVCQSASFAVIPRFLRGGLPVNMSPTAINAAHFLTLIVRVIVARLPLRHLDSSVATTNDFLAAQAAFDQMPYD